MRSITLCLLLLTTAAAFAQMEDIPTELWWGSKEKAPAGSYLTKIIAAGDWGAYLLRYRPGSGLGKGQAWLEEYDGRFALRGRHEMNASRKDANLEDVIALRGQLYVLTSREEQDALRMWIRPISPRAQVTGTEIQLAEMAADDRFRRRQFDCVFSADSSRLLVYNQLPPEKNGPERFTLRVFDERFSLLWSRDVTLPYRDEGFSIRTYRVDREGNVYLMGRQRPTEGTERKPPQHVVYAYRNNGKAEIEYQIQIDGIEFSNLRLEIAANGDLACAGFYSTPEVRGSIGIAHLRIDPNTKAARRVDLLPFPEAFITKATQEAKQSSTPALMRYHLKDLTLRSDGGIVLVAEQFFRQERREMSPTSGPRVTTYDNYNDIIVANVAPDGTYSWLRRIPKRQRTPNDRGAISSFAQTTVRDRFLFLYNDHADRFDPEEDRRSVMDGRDPVLTLTEIRRDGQINSIPLYVDGGSDVAVQPRRCRQIGARLVLMYGEDGRHYRMGVLKIE